MLGTAWGMTKQTITEFIDDNALSRGAAIAYYTIFSLAPILFICIAVAGLVFGRDAVQGALVGQLQGLMGHQGAHAIQTMVQGAANKKSGIIATIIGIGTLIVTATGVFSELQMDLNAIWRAQAPAGFAGILKVRAIGLGLVGALGFLMLVSLVISAALTAFGHMLSRTAPGLDILFQIANFVISFALISVLFAAIYKVLPDKRLAWRDVAVGAVATAVLFTIGKYLIGAYIGTAAVASSYGAAGSAIVVLLWIYYSAEIFLLGAEFTKVYARHRGSRAAPPEPGTEAAAQHPVQPARSASPAASAPQQHPELAPKPPRPRRAGALVDSLTVTAFALALLRERRRS